MHLSLYFSHPTFIGGAHAGTLHACLGVGVLVLKLVGLQVRLTHLVPSFRLAPSPEEACSFLHMHVGERGGVETYLVHAHHVRFQLMSFVLRFILLYNLCFHWQLKRYAEMPGSSTLPGN